MVAVSGGVDSVVLLDLLEFSNRYDLVVAHFDHGIRDDSAEDEQFVKKLAEAYNLPFVSARGNLGANASEAKARQARYDFLRAVCTESEAEAIITAHHQDDVIETAVLNLLRGTKRRGITSLKSTRDIYRPLVGVSKAEILEYAQQHKLRWREDSTNSDERYLRNKIRAQFMKKNLKPEDRQKILKLLDEVSEHNEKINEIVVDLLQGQSQQVLDKKFLNRTGLAEAYELAAEWLRRNKIGFDEATIKRLVIGARTLRNGAEIDLQGNYYCRIGRTEITLGRR